MSAVSGLVQISKPIDVENLEKQRGALKIHGPDASGVWRDQHCGLVSNLRHVTPEDLHETQPLAMNGFTIVADVRLDNRDELCPKLGLSSTGKDPITDTALILRSFEKWGKGCLDHLIGAFVFAIWDQRSHSLFLARDQRGEKTVFYHESKGRFAFASMPKGLFALPGIERKLNERKLAEFLILDHSNHATTFYEKIYRLPPAHFLQLQNGHCRLQKYWSFDLESRITYKTDVAYAEHGRELLESCIKSNLRSASPIGAMMSGGLDSSIVACIASEMLGREGKKLPTFTEVPSIRIPENHPKRYFDETPYVNEISAKNPNIAPHFIQGLKNGLFEGIEERFRVLEAPYRNPFNQLWLEEIWRAASTRGIKVLLTGQSGNFTLSYHGLWRLPNLLRSSKFFELFGELNGLAQTTGESKLKLIKSHLLTPLVPDSLRTLFKQRNGSAPYWRNHSGLNRDFAEKHRIPSLPRRFPIDSRAKRIEALYSADFVGEFNQSAIATTGTELRDPLGDIRFVQWTLSLPERQFLSRGNQRWLAKRVGEDVLPKSVLSNNKIGLQAADWAEHFEKSLPDIQCELEAAAGSRICRDVLQLDELKRVFSSWGKADSNSAFACRYKLCRSLVAARFMQTFPPSV